MHAKITWFTVCALCTKTNLQNKQDNEHSTANIFTPALQAV